MYIVDREFSAKEIAVYNRLNDVTYVIIPTLSTKVSIKLTWFMKYIVHDSKYQNDSKV